MLWGGPTNTRRANSAQLVIAALGRAGFEVTAPGSATWPSQRTLNEYDAMFFAWVKSSLTQKGNSSTYCTLCGNNTLGYSNAKVDAAEKKLGAGLLSEKEKLAQYLIIEKELVNDAVSLPIFQHPGVTGVNAKLQNIKPNPLSPQLVWNYWEWKYSN
jgi:peptide/nickel transport system substrate-binding protein